MSDPQEENLREGIDINSVEERYSFEQKEQWIQKAFLTVLVAFLILGMLGLYGKGYFSDREFSASNFKVEYQRFLRSDTETDLYVNLIEPADTTVISFPANYIKQVKINQITPAPESVSLEKDKLHFNFITSDNGIIAFYLQPEWFGSKKLEIGIQDEVIRLNQYVYF